MICIAALQVVTLVLLLLLGRNIVLLKQDAASLVSTKVIENNTVVDMSELEKNVAAVMERYGFEWEQKGTHEEHLSDYDYKKKMRAAEVAELTEQVSDLKEKVADQQGDFKEMSNRIQNYDKAEKSLDELKKELDTSPDYALPEPQGLMTVKSYKAKFADPLIKKLKHLVLSIMARYFEAMDAYHRLNNANSRYYRANERLTQENEYLTAKNAELQEENRDLRAENKDFALLRKVFGRDRIDDLISEAQELQEQKRKQNRSYERG